MRRVSGLGAPRKSPSVEMSSSRSGQCRPYPAPAISQFARFARAKRGTGRGRPPDRM